MRGRHSKGKGKEIWARDHAPETPSCSLSTGGPENELGQTRVQSQSSHEIRIRRSQEPIKFDGLLAQPVISEFSTFLKFNKSGELFFTVKSFCPIYG